MAYPKGKGRAPGSGRKKGTLNHKTVLAKEAIARFVDGNADRLQGWLDEIAETEGPVIAFRCFSELLEYHVPKLSRAELTGPDGSALQVNVNDPTRRDR